MGHRRGAVDKACLTVFQAERCWSFISTGTPGLGEVFVKSYSGAAFCYGIWQLALLHSSDVCGIRLDSFVVDDESEKDDSVTEPLTFSKPQSETKLVQFAE